MTNVNLVENDIFEMLFLCKFTRENYIINNLGLDTTVFVVHT